MLLCPPNPDEGAVMTDARYPERWLLDARYVLLSDGAYRLYFTGLVWSVSNRTDGRISDRHVPLLQAVDTLCAPELVQAGLWRRDDDGWFILDFDTTQTTSAELARAEEARKVERDKKARQRGKSGTVPPAIPAGRPGGDQQGDAVGQDRTRHARTGGSTTDPDLNETATRRWEAGYDT